MSRDQAIREALRDEMIVALGAIPSRVYEYWALGLMPDDWPGMLRLPSKIVHGYLVHWVSGTQFPMSMEQSEFAAMYQITGYHSHTGKNSMDTFGTALENAAAQLKPGVLAAVNLNHDGLQWESIDVAEVRNELMHVAVGRITFRIPLC